MSLVSDPGAPTWLCGYGFLGDHFSKTADKVTDPANDILGGLASLDP